MAAEYSEERAGGQQMTRGCGVLSSVTGSQNIWLGSFHADGGGQGSRRSCGGEEQAVAGTVNMPGTHAVMLTDALPERLRREGLTKSRF